MKRPRIRVGNITPPPYPLNRFPREFPYTLASELVCIMAVRGQPSLEGKEWEKIFATCIGAQWKPSNVGLNDVVLEQTAWGCKTVKHDHPATVKRVRLISGRNSPVYSFGGDISTEADPSELGRQVLQIWNERVSKVRERFANLRTVVLIKGPYLKELAVFEFDTVRYEEEGYIWEWNANKNLVGYDRLGVHRFTWQPHGSQFTIVQDVPSTRLAIRLRAPAEVDREEILKAVGFSRDWVEILPAGKDD